MKKSPKLQVASAACGGLSQPSKMPGYGYGLPANECITGSKLRAVPGTVCSKCYAFLRGNYGFNNVLAKQYERLHLVENSPTWVEDMVRALKETKNRWFRWHDSGDLQSVDHLRKICAVAAATPEIKHWLPTKEYKFVVEYLRSGGNVPANLSVRLTAYKIDGKPPTKLAQQLGVGTAGVRAKTAGSGHVCPAPENYNKCDTCRACWDRSVQHVTYTLH